MSYQAEILSMSKGGSNANLTADNGGVLYSTASAMAIVPHTATANQPLLSGASGAPGWSTATYPGTTTANQLLYSSATNTVGGLASANNGTLVTSAAGVPSILAGPGTTGNILQSNAAAPPSFSTATYPATAGTSGNVLTSDGTNFTSATPKAFTVNTQTFTSTGTYTPTSGMVYCIIEVLGGGGGGGGAANSGGLANNSGAGGGSGGYAKALYTAAQIGASKSVTIGAAGAAGAAGNNTGGTGGTTSVGATLLSAVGGSGGAGASGSATATTSALGGSGGTASVTSGTSIIAIQGNFGGYGWATGSSITSPSGVGADSIYGSGARSVVVADNDGNASTVYGSGGSGGYSVTTDKAGGAGSAGLVLVTEYIFA